MADKKWSYICNTDKKASPAHHQAMLNEHKAAAYGTSYDQQIKQIQKKDIVFLYENGVGLVAFGYASGDMKSVPKDVEYAMQQHIDGKAIKFLITP